MKTIRKRAAVVLASAALAAASAALADDIIVGISFDKMESFREGELKAIEAAAAELGVKTIFQNAQEDAQRQASQIESMIAQGAKAIVAIPWDIQAAVNDAGNAREADVAFVTLDQAPADLAAVDFHTGGDPCADGRTAGELFAKVADGKPFKLLELQGKLKKVGEDGHITIVSIDGAPTGCQAVRDGLIDMDIATPVGEMAKRAVAAAVAAAKGEATPETTAFLPGMP